MTAIFANKYCNRCEDVTPHKGFTKSNIEGEEVTWHCNRCRFTYRIDYKEKRNAEDTDDGGN